MKKTFVNMISSIAHVRSFGELLFNTFATILAFIFGYFKIIAIDNINLFMAVFIVVIGDWLFGTFLAIRNKSWETRKALKVVYYLTGYWLIVFIVLSIEKAHAAAFFLSEAVVLPILIFQVISMLKNASLLGVLPKGLLLKILSNIDNYKDQAIEQTKELQNEAN